MSQLDVEVEALKARVQGLERMRDLDLRAFAEELHAANKAIDEARAQVAMLRETAEMVLLYHAGSPWDEAKSKRWKRWTGNDEATTRNLCSQIRSTLAATAPKGSAK